MKALESKLAENDEFKILDEALAGMSLPEKKLRFRWHCLLFRQNQLRGFEAQRLENALNAAHVENEQLRDELSEGTSQWFADNLVRVMETTSHPTKEENESLHRDLEQVRKEWREGKGQKEKAENDAKIRESERRRKRSGIASPFHHQLDWTQRHSAQEYVDAFAEPTIHTKWVRKFLMEFAPEAQRRGLGRNKELEFPFEAGMRLYEEVMTKWITDAEKYREIMMATITHQVAQRSALTPAGFKFRELLVRLISTRPCDMPTDFPHLEAMLAPEMWEAWHRAISATSGDQLSPTAV
jgi:hypothetical protein